MLSTARLLIAATLFLTGCTHLPGPSVTKPKVIAFGSTVADMETALANHCSDIEVRSIDPSPVPEVQDHRQIDCRGFDYFDGSRLAEFVFLDDRLMLVWILVEPEEVDLLERAFVSALGEPDAKTSTIALFTDERAGVRREVPEALFYASDVAPMVEARAQAAP